MILFSKRFLLKKFFSVNKNRIGETQYIHLVKKLNVVTNSTNIQNKKDLVFINKKAIQILKQTPHSLLEFSNLNISKKTEARKMIIDSNDSHASRVQALFQNKPDTVDLNRLNPTSAQGKTVKLSENLNNLKLQKAKASLLSKYVFNKFFICCKECRIESATSYYGCFLIGPFNESLSQTLAHNIRRTLLSQLSGLAIIAVEIDGVLHKFSNLPGLKESVLDLICNLQNIVFKKRKDFGIFSPQAADRVANAVSKKNRKPSQTSLPLAKSTVNTQETGHFTFGLEKASNLLFEKMELIAYLRVRGPGVVTATDILLPSGIQCVNPDQYIATLAEDGFLNMKIYIQEGQNFIKQKQKNLDLNEIKENLLVSQKTGAVSNKGAEFLNGSQEKLVNKTPSVLSFDASTNKSYSSNYEPLINKTRNKIYLDSVFMPVTKVNTFVQANPKSTDDLLENHLQFRLLKNGDLTTSLSGNPKKTFEQSQKTVRLITLRKTKTNLLDHNRKDLTHTYHFSDSKGSIFKLKKNQQKDFNTLISTSNFSLKESLTDSDLNIKTSDFKKTTQSKNQEKKIFKTFFSTNPSIEQKFKEQVVILTSSLPSKTSSGVGQSLTPEALRNNRRVETLLRNKVVSKQSHIFVEIWTNGSIHPREALKSCIQFLADTFISLENVKMLGSMFKTELTYAKLLKKIK